jgi:hypothetical protein
MTLEQQICLLKASDAVKEKAMVKLREIKSKSDDTTTKARQYLEGLLKIPFGVYIKENIMEECNKVKDSYTTMCIKNDMQEFIKVINVPLIHNSSSNSMLEIKNSCIKINENIKPIGLLYIDKFIADILNDKQRKKGEFTTILQKITTFIKKHKLVLPTHISAEKNDKSKTITLIKTSIDNYMKELYIACQVESSQADAKYAKDIGDLIDELFKDIISECKMECKSPIMNISDIQSNVGGILKTVAKSLLIFLQAGYLFDYLMS